MHAKIMRGLGKRHAALFDQPITIAGLWDQWRDKSTGEELKSCAMVITEPNKFVAEVHDRMPVILEEKDFEQWESGDVKDAAALMKPAGESIVRRWPVSTGE